MCADCPEETVLCCCFPAAKKFSYDFNYWLNKEKRIKNYLNIYSEKVNAFSIKHGTEVILDHLQKAEYLLKKVTHLPTEISNIIIKLDSGYINTLEFTVEPEIPHITIYSNNQSYSSSCLKDMNIYSSYGFANVLCPNQFLRNPIPCPIIFSCFCFPIAIFAGILGAGFGAGNHCTSHCKERLVERNNMHQMPSAIHFFFSTKGVIKKDSPAMDRGDEKERTQLIA